MYYVELIEQDSSIILLVRDIQYEQPATMCIGFNTFHEALLCQRILLQKCTSMRRGQLLDYWYNLIGE